METKIVKQQLFRVVPLPKDLILVSRKHHPRVYYERIHKLLMGNEKSVVLQATGACIERAVDIALEVESKYSGISLETETFTMPCTDQVQRSTSDFCEERERLINGIVITITKIN